jgi:nicotinamide-nucleotide adenylyltransferase
MILILGRFQPLHNGHMKVISDAYAEDKDLVIAIGSAGKVGQKTNPFSGEERKQMLDSTLRAAQIYARTVLVPDRQSDEGYVDHVLQQIRGKPDKVITENPWTINLFTKAGFNVAVTDRHFDISSTDIRDRISRGDKWEHLVPQKVAEFVRKSGGAERVRRIYLT